VNAVARARAQDPVAESERLLEQGDATGAVALLSDHLQRAPKDAAAFVALARAAIEVSEPSWALELLRAAEPLANARIRQRIAVVRADVMRRQNLDAQAITAYRAVCQRKGQAEPRVVADAFFGLAHIELKRAHKDVALELLEKAFELVPGHRNARCIHAELLCDRGDHEGALASLRAAIADGGGDGRIYNMVGIVLRRLGRPADAESAFRIAIQLAPHDPSPAHHLGIVLFEQGRHDDAARVFADTVARHQDDEVAAHMAAALTGAAAPARAADGYVKETFDNFADSFEEKLVGKLHYRVPGLIAEAIARHLLPEGRLEILDLGCGTGLCGPILRPYASHLVGVDLSPKMVEKARLRGDYDDLLITEITGYLRTRPASFDLLVAADVFVYFGDLREVLAASAASIRGGGHYAFTLERCTTGEDWRLNLHGRYSHGEDYIRRLAAEAGFEVISIESVVPRHEGGQPVQGMLVVLRKA
jgi:predicted TPR repeat methyltransferase